MWPLIIAKRVGLVWVAFDRTTGRWGVGLTQLSAIRRLDRAASC